MLERLELFERDRGSSLLDDHPLSPPFTGIRSISVTGDLRIHYEFIAENAVNLVDFGTHSELYGK